MQENMNNKTIKRVRMMHDTSNFTQELEISEFILEEDKYQSNNKRDFFFLNNDLVVFSTNISILKRLNNLDKESLNTLDDRHKKVKDKLFLGVVLIEDFGMKIITLKGDLEKYYFGYINSIKTNR